MLHDGMHLKQQQVIKSQSIQSNSNMSLSVQINIKKTMEKNLNDMAGNVQLKTIEALAEIYGFDASEAMNKIGLEIKTTEKKMTNKTKTKTPSVPLPWCGEVNNEWCCGLRPNGGLQTQCMNSKMDGGKFCKTCQKQCEKNDDGKPNYGEVSDRMEAGDEYAGAKGKKPVKYSQVMAKKGITREEAEREAAKHGWTIPESEFEVVVKSTKKKKTTTVSDTESESDSETENKPKKRGRPAKKKVVKNEDQLAKMVDTVKASNSSSESETEMEKPKKKVKKVKKDKKVKKEKKELTEEEKAAKKEETNRKRKETREKNKAKKEEAEKKAAELSGDELEEAIDLEIEDLENSGSEAEEEKSEGSVEDECVEVSNDNLITKTIDGIEYYMQMGDADKCLYDKVTMDCVGTYDEKNNVMKQLSDTGSDSDSDSESDDE